MTIRSVNPFNNEILKEFEPLSKSELFDRIEKADAAFQSWRHFSFNRRSEHISKFAELLRNRQEELARLITIEMGKRISESEYEIEYCAKIAEFYARNAESFLADQPMELVEANAYVQHVPIGVLLGIMPWNFPFYQVVRFAVPNIMAGNTVMIKHASNVPQCALELEKLFNEAGLPDGVFTTSLIPTDHVDDAIADDRIKGVSLTGSGPAGSAVAQAAGRQIKKSVLELGGNDPFVVLDDADIKRTAQMALKGRLVNNGQSCVASKRFIIVDSIADDFLAQFKLQMESVKSGDPIDRETRLGPLSTESAAERLDQQVQSAIDAGANVLTGGGRPEREGAFYDPTILTDVGIDNPVFDDELFGPVAVVYTVKDQQEAIAMANRSSFGLGASVFTEDIDVGRKVAEQIESGMVFVNKPTKSQAELPFGGTKKSGYGKELSRLGILEFVNRKLIHLGR